VSLQACGDNNLVCLVYRRATSFELPDGQGLAIKKTYQCLPASSNEDQTYDLPLSQAFINSHPELQLGLTHISIPRGCLNGTSVTYPENATVTILKERRRLSNPQTRVGNITILVVRGLELNRVPFQSTSVLSSKIFDRASVSLASQIRDCSAGKLNIGMAQGPGIVDGILDVQLGYRVKNISTSVVEEQLIQAVSPYGGERAFDHVMYCIPFGTLSGTTNQWVAHALTYHPRSVYNDNWCGFLSPHVHEFGHNLGLQHSGQYGNMYGDITGMMGYASRIINGPKSCYNAHNNWELGWYQGRSIDLSHTIRDSAWGGRLMAFVDIDATPLGEVVVIRAGNLYMQYNRRRSFNEGTRQFGNRVVIVSAKDHLSVSQLEAGVAIGISGASKIFAYPDFDDTGYNLVIEVCDQVYGPPDYVHISIHLADGIQSSQCAFTLPPLTRAPTVAPTTSVQPSNAPTKSPSDQPSQTRTQSPTTSPTCEDIPGKSFHVNRKRGYQDCAWLSARPMWKPLLCEPGHRAYHYCKESCNSCKR
jgi:Gametolysin peptidase M11